MMLFNPDAAASCDAEFRMMGDLPPWLLALTGYGKVATQHRRASRAHGFAISPRKSREVCQKFPYPLIQRAQGMPGARCAR
jgi:hypothetical protein